MVEKVNDPTMKSILEYRNHPTISALQGKLKSNSPFAFCYITLEEILKELVNLGDNDVDDDDGDDDDDELS